jgi:hypothetical protein
MIRISEKSSGGALVDWVPEGHDRKYTEPAAMSIPKRRRFGSSDQKRRRNGAARRTRHDDSPAPVF